MNIDFNVTLKSFHKQRLFRIQQNSLNSEQKQVKSEKVSLNV